MEHIKTVKQRRREKRDATIFSLYMSKELTMADLSRRYDLNYTTIYRIIRKEKEAHRVSL